MGNTSHPLDDPAADPFGLLRRRIDDLAEAGVLLGADRGGEAETRREDAAVAAWTTVHGLGLLLTEGSLRRLPAARRAGLVAAALDMVESGLCGPVRPGP